MGVRRGAFERAKRGEVWRPSAITASIPTINAGAALKEYARAVKARGEYDAAKWLGIGKIVDSLIKVVDVSVGIKRQQEKRMEEALIQREIYKADCTRDPSKYNADKAMILEQDYQDCKKSHDSITPWDRDAEKVKESGVVESWLESQQINASKDERMKGILKKRQEEVNGAQSQHADSQKESFVQVDDPNTMSMLI